MTESAGEIVEKHLKRVSKLAQEQKGYSFSQFLGWFGAAVGQQRMLLRAREKGYDVVMSVDLCELLDTAFPIEHHRRGMAELEPLLQRRILTDIHFSREAMRVILQGGFKFTLLPGAASELLQFLRSAYSRHGAVCTVLKERGIQIGQKIDWRKQGLEKPVYDYFESYMKGVCEAVPHDRLVGLVSALLGHEKFVSPIEFVNTTDLQEGLLRVFLQALDGVRSHKKGKFSNLADALNLTICSSVNAEREHRLLTHMTRTFALHRLSDTESVQVDVSMEKNAGGLTYPILCHPEVICLWELMFPGGKTPSDAYERAEGFERFWANLSSLFREYEQAIMCGKATATIQKLLESIEAILVQEEGYAQVFEQFMELFTTDIAQVEQVFDDEFQETIIDSDDQRRTMNLRIEQLDFYARHLQLRELCDYLRTKTGLDLAMAKMVQRERLATTAFVRDTTKLEELGFLVDESGRGGEPDFWEARATKLGARRTKFALGVQMYVSNGHKSATVFWPSSRRIRAFVSSVGEALMEKNGSSTCAVLGVGYNDRLGLHECEIADLTNPRAVLKRLPQRPLRVCQIRWADAAFTCEVDAVGRAPFCSAEFRDSIPSHLFTVYEATSSTLPKELFLDFVRCFFEASQEG